MIIELKMKCWRQHLDRVINFTSGLNAIRGANEAGKTSTMMAVNYCLWGVKAVPLPLEELVTWGRNAKELSVEVIVSVNGELYHFKRSKAGAECNHSGGVVTGQNEVTKFATELMKADADLASKLMFASQKGLNSLLDTGTAALSGYIEDLAGMDLFDTLLDRIARKWVTGPTTAIDNAIANLKLTVDAGIPAAPDVSDLNADIERIEANVTRNEASLIAARRHLTDVSDAYSDAKAKADQGVALASALGRATSANDNRKVQLEAAKRQAAVVVDVARMTALEQAIADETLNKVRFDTYTKFSALQANYPEDTWEGTFESLENERREVSNKVLALSDSSKKTESDIRVLDAKRVTSSVCGFCNQDMSKFPEVAAKNAQIEADIEAKSVALKDTYKQLSEQREYLDALDELIAVQKPFERFATANAKDVDADTNVVPWKLTWIGDVPQAAQNTQAMAVELETLKATERAANLAAAKIEPLEQQLNEDAVNIVALKAQLAELPDVANLEELAKSKQEAELSVTTLEACIKELVGKVQTIETHKSRLFAEHKIAERNFEAAKVALAEKEKERDELLANNLLVKKIKAARPVVAAKLWSIVLASTSQMFSKMRGEASVVTKGTDSFLVNNRPVKVLSGSATDLLGLALRVSLIKTFIPECSILALDEPMAASDDDRTLSMLGFMSSVDFQQVLLVTHESVSETVANNLIMI